MKRWVRRGAVTALVVAALLYGAWWWALRSEWVREKLRARAVLEIEKATGGKAELGRLDFDPSLLNVTIERFTLHGTEPAGEPPLAQVERVRVGLKILSFVKSSVDVGRIEIDRPRVRVTVDADGKTNLPSPVRPRPSTGRGPVEEILRLAADAFVVRDGEFSYDAKKYRFTASGKSVAANFDYDGAGPVYRGSVQSESLEVQAANLPRLPVNLAVKMVVEKDAVAFPELHLESGPSIITGQGRIEQFRAAHGTFELAVRSNLTETQRLFQAAAGSGAIESKGRFDWLGGTEIRYEGNLRGAALDTAIGGIRVKPLAITAKVLATSHTASLTDVRAEAAEGVFRGSAALPGYDGYRVEGTIERLALRTVLDKTGTQPIGYSGLLSGPIRVESKWRGGLTAEGTLDVAPDESGVPLEGQVALRYERATNQLSLRDSHLRTPHASIEVAGTLMQTLRVKFQATDLADVRPALEFGGATEPLPVRLDPKGSVQFEGTVSGSLKSPLVAGQVRANGAIWGELRADALSSTVVASAERLTLTRFSVTHEGATANGSGTIGLHNWKMSGASAIDVRAEARGMNVSNLRRQANITEPLEGLLNVTGQLEGTVDEPRGELLVDWFRPSYRDEHLDRLRARLLHGQNTLRVESFEAARGPARLTGSGNYMHGKGDWRNGTVTATFQLAGLEMSTFPAIQELRKGAKGQLTANGKVQARVTNGEAALTSIDGQSRLGGVSIDNRPYGELNVTAATRNGGELEVAATGSVRGAPLRVTSRWKLAAGYPGTARLEFSELPFAVFNELRPARVAAQAWPFAGAFRGSVDMRGPLLDMERWQVDVTLQDLYARPSRRTSLPGKVSAQDFELRNDGPVRFSADGRTVTIRSAKFVAPDTNLSATGTFSLAERRPWDLRVDGRVNLAGLRTFSQDLVASGVATIQANIRGELASPQVFGALELKNATLNLDGVPNGLDKVSGRVLFDRRRATIENRLTAESGGGALALGGFIDFSGEDTFYRLQAEAARVRIRYPEGVSTVADANLSLSGTTERSLVAGTVTVLRSGFTPRTDLGSLLAESSRGAATPKEANRFLANMQIDVKVRTAPETQFTTSLTRDLQAEANLQIRGTGARPVALGRITISQGDINFFGNKYSIKRGEVSFYNPTKVEPTLDMDLETRVRGVDVTVNFTGPIDKLNVSYRSDPPLQPSEIIALLTVGRTPTSSTVGSSQSAAKGSFLESGANSLLGSAISAPISSQLQRFFGVSRIKIDPTIAGLEGTPQARVTVEQQVTRDVTITFVTNLNRSQQQVVRFEWNVSKEWSLIALRDENGAFGVDFQVRKQVK